MKTKSLLAAIALLAVAAGVVVYLRVSREPTESPPAAVPPPPASAPAVALLPKPKPKTLPPIPTGTTDADKALAAAANDLRQGIRDLSQAKTNSELAARKKHIQELSQALAQGGPTALPAVKALLADPRIDVRTRALGILHDMKHGCVIEPLCAVVQHDDTKAARNLALMYLAELPADRVVPEAELIARTEAARYAALADPDVEVRKMAQQAQWAICHRLEGYAYDAPEPARQGALDKLRSAIVTGDR